MGSGRWVPSTGGDFDSRKCGYTQPKRNMRVPENENQGDATRTGTRGRKKATARRARADDAKSVPLNGFPFSQARTLTDSSGIPSRIPTTRFVGPTPSAMAIAIVPK
jgi:hypothetical protein